MRKASHLFLLIIVLLVYFLETSSLSAVTKSTRVGGEKFAPRELDQDKVTRLSGLPPQAMDKISKHLKKTEYEICRTEKTLPSGEVSTYRAFNRTQNLNAYFANEGVHLFPHGTGEPAWHLMMSLDAFGRDGAMEQAGELRSDALKVSGKRVEYQRGSTIEWYKNDERGLEQGITLNRPPAGKGTGPLMVTYTISGSLVPKLEHEGNAIIFNKTESETILRYSGLKAWDATGRTLSAKLALRCNAKQVSISQIAFMVDDTNALYPVTIDPIFTQVAKITASDGAAEDAFSYSVSISGDTVVVGAYLDDGLFAPNTGSAYIFDRDEGGADNWGEVKKITAGAPDADDWFAFSVSISGDTVVIGSYRDDDNGTDSGAAYIFDRNWGGLDNWGVVKKITSNDIAAGDRFGYSVSISGDAVVVGATYDDDYGTTSGSAYIFDRDFGGLDNWGQVKKITAPDGAATDWFGFSVAISGNAVVVGVHRDDDNGSNSGSAYIFDRDFGGLDNWGQVQKIAASDGAADDWFGFSVAISGNTVVVGAYQNDAIAFNSGSAYIFDRDFGGLDNWGEVTQITTSDGVLNDFFGCSVAISGNMVVAGAYGDDDNGSTSGSAYIFDRNEGGIDNWGEVDKITAGDGAVSDYFGRSSVSISGDTAVVSAYQDDDNGIDSGSAYVYQQDTDGDGVPDDEDNCPDDPNPGQEDTGDSDGVGDACDNCPNTPNPVQWDTYPPQGNDIGDACDCEADFNCDGNVDATDVTNFLLDFGRNQFNNPCTNGIPCNGDINCDTNVDATDVTNFLEDFGRNHFNNVCPACVVGDWCVYP